MANNAPATITSDTLSMPVIAESDALIAAEAAVTGDWSKLAPAQRIQLYGAVCKSMGLNPLTQPFGWFSQGGKLVLYAFKGATDQLRKLNGVDVVSVDQNVADGLLITTVKVQDQTGRSDMDVGVVPFGNELKGEARANAMMKSITKAKRRATLSLVGLGIMDESEIDSIPRMRREQLDMSSGEILGSPDDTQPTPPAPRAPRQSSATVAEVTNPVVEDPERHEAKTTLWNFAKNTCGWDLATLDAVAADHSKVLNEMGAEELKTLYTLLVTESAEQRQERVDRATGVIEATQQTLS